MVHSFNTYNNYSNNNWERNTRYKNLNKNKRKPHHYLSYKKTERKKNVHHNSCLLAKISAEDVFMEKNSSTNINSNTTRTTTTTDPLCTSSSIATTNIVFPGGGIFFYHQAGVVNFLREEGYDLSHTSFSGASAGALTATLAATGVDFYEATDLALKMAADAGIWDRSNGLQGIWGPLIEDWLNELLPQSIESVQGRITILITPIPSFGKSKISHFEDRNDLIQCNMASVHLPWFLDGKLTRNYRSRPHIDGSFLSKDEDYIPDKKFLDNRDDTDTDTDAVLRTTTTISLDWTKDPYMSSKISGMDFVEALSPDGIRDLLDRGKKYGKIMEDQGIFDSLNKKCL